MEEIPRNSHSEEELDDDLSYALSLAWLLGDEELVDMLLARGADVNLSDLEGATPIFDFVSFKTSYQCFLPIKTIILF